MVKILDRTTTYKFSNRILFLLSALGIAVGTGNIWRFPRVVALSSGNDGAASFLIIWLFFLFSWSIPIIVLEYYIGYKYKRSIGGIIYKIAGPNNIWIGLFVAAVSTFISFYYAVVCSWSIYYLFYFIFNPPPQKVDIAFEIWQNFQNGNLKYIVHLFIVILGLLAIRKSVYSIEKLLKFIMPGLFLIVLFIFVRTLFLDGSSEGMKFLFTIDFKQFKNPEVWLQALTQNAWDTGAGWGLFILYAAHLKSKHRMYQNAFITGILNNLVSLIMAITIFGLTFSILYLQSNFSKSEVIDIMKSSGPASTGLTFIWLPMLFNKIYGGKIINILFFIGLAFAGFSSLISMYEQAIRSFIDLGFKRKNIIPIFFVLAYFLGLIAVRNINFLNNQDFVWGIGLIISGLIIIYYAVKAKIIKDISSQVNNKLIKTLSKLIIKYFISSLSIVLLLWWLIISITKLDSQNWFNPFSTYSLTTCILQWFFVGFLLFLFNKLYIKLSNINKQIIN